MRLAAVLLVALISISLVSMASPVVRAWGNGGWSSDPSDPDYGTHDWLAEHALDWLPPMAKQEILPYKAFYVFGTETPDRSGCGDCYGDAAAKHHVYYHKDGSLQDDAGAKRAKEIYDAAWGAIRSGNSTGVAVLLGAMTHYIDDLAVFGHVMGAATDWGAEVHHSDYENYVNARTSTYDSEFTVFLAFDGNLEPRDPYDAALLLAFDTTFGGASDKNATWMDQHYDWSNSEFKNRAGESLNLAANYLAEVLYGLWLAMPCMQHNSMPEWSRPTLVLAIVLSLAVVVARRKALIG